MLATVKNFNKEDKKKVMDDCKDVIEHTNAKRISFKRDLYEPILKKLDIDKKYYTTYRIKFSSVFNKVEVAKFFLLHLENHYVELPILKYVYVERQFMMELQSCNIADVQLLDFVLCGETELIIIILLLFYSRNLRTTNEHKLSILKVN